MNKNEFNKKCAEYMGYVVVPDDQPSSQKMNRVHLDQLCYWGDLYEMVDVVDELRNEMPHIGRRQELLHKLLLGQGIKQALRDFITECLNP